MTDEHPHVDERDVRFTTQPTCDPKGVRLEALHVPTNTVAESDLVRSMELAKQSAVQHLEERLAGS